MHPPLRILVAENNPDDAFFLRCAFEQAEIEASVSFVRDGQELIDYLKGEPPFENPIVHPFPTMLLLDLDLPRIDGFRFLAWLQKEKRMQELIVIILSGSEVSLDFERAYGLGAVDYLVKPHNPQQLIPIVQNLQKLWLQLAGPSASSHPTASHLA
jgi:CheY-like chemotaxis protein